MNEAADFKSDVSTNFTTGAKALLCLQVELFDIKKPSNEGFFYEVLRTLISLLHQIAGLYPCFRPLLDLSLLSPHLILAGVLIIDLIYLFQR